MKKISLSMMLASLPGHISSRSDLTNEEKTILAAVWHRYNNTPAKTSGVVIAGAKTMGQMTGIEPQAVRNISKKLSKEGFFTYTLGKPAVEGGRPTAASYIIYMKAWANGEQNKAEDFKTLVDRYFSKDYDSEEEMKEAYIKFAGHFSTKDERREAIRLSYRKVMIDGREIFKDNRYKRNKAVQQLRDLLVKLNKIAWGGDEDLSIDIHAKCTEAETWIDKSTTKRTTPTLNVNPEARQRIEEQCTAVQPSVCS